MKTFFLRFFILSAGIITLAVGNGFSPQNSHAETSNAPVRISPSVVGTNSIGMIPDSPGAFNAASQKDVTPSPAALPPDISVTSPLAQVIRLTQAGVDQSIIMSFVTNSSHLFNLDSDKIIYLSDLGAPNDLVAAMMQHDQQLQDQFNARQAAQLAQQTQTEPSAPYAESASTNATEVAAQPETQPAPVTVNYFYDTLQPYGSWVFVNGYGRCWRPTVCIYNSGWQPYCDRGNWVYTDCGWYWNSDYAWGVTFHYGRWFRNGGFGWCWCPGTVWAPSWVTWRYSNNYCGWAPLPPRTSYQAGVGIVYNGGAVSIGFNFGLGASCYTFVPTQHFCDPHPRNYCIGHAQLTQVYNNTTVINNFNVNRNHTVVNNGIAAGTIATAARTPIRQVPIREINAGNFSQNYGQSYNRFGSTRNLDNHHNSYNGSSSPSPADAGVRNNLPRPNYNWHERSSFNDASNPSGSAQARNALLSAPNYALPNHSQTFASIPQRQEPRLNYPMTPTRVSQTPSANFYSQPLPANGRPTVAPRANLYSSNGSQNSTGSSQSFNDQSSVNYSSPRNYNPPANYGQQNYRSATAPSSASAYSQRQGGNQGGGRGWPGH